MVLTYVHPRIAAAPEGDAEPAAPKKTKPKYEKLKRKPAQIATGTQPAGGEQQATTEEATAGDAAETEATAAEPQLEEIADSWDKLSLSG